jgi:hypothetical protein
VDLHQKISYCIYQNNLDSISLYVLNTFLLDILGNRQHQFVCKNRTVCLHLEKLRSFTLDYDYTILPSNSYIPFNPNANFVGREAELAELFLMMIGDLNNIGINLVGVVGMTSIGKTRLVIELAYRFGFAFPDGVYWVQAADSNQWLRQFVVIAKDYLQLTIQTNLKP